MRPRQPYLDWAAGLDDSGLVPDPDDEQTIYLIPSFEDDEEAWEIVEEIYAEVFERVMVGLNASRSQLAAARLRYAEIL